MPRLLSVHTYVTSPKFMTKYRAPLTKSIIVWQVYYRLVFKVAFIYHRNAGLDERGGHVGKVEAYLHELVWEGVAQGDERGCC